MKILLLGDMHRDIEIAKKIVDAADVDYVLQVGDMTVYSTFSKPIYFIAGNHENFGIIKAMDKGRIKFDNLRHIKTSGIINRVFN